MKIFTQTLTLLIVCSLFQGKILATEKSGPLYSDLDQALQYRISADLGFENQSFHFIKRNNTYTAQKYTAGVTANVNSSGVTFISGNHSWNLSLKDFGSSRVCLSGSKLLESAKVEENRLEFTNGPQMTAWYVNGPWGFQQGWTINNPLTENTGELVLSFDFSGDLDPLVLENRRGLALKDESGLTIFNYTGLTAYDANKKQLPVWFEKHGQTIDIKVNDSGAVYPVVIDPWVQLAKLTASSKVVMDYMSISIAISGDGSTVAAGAYLSDSIAPGPVAIGGTGSVFVYTKPAGGWVNATQTAILIAKVKAANDWLGNSVAINSDGSIIAAGAHGYDPGGTSGAGALFVFIKPGGGWVNGYQQAMLTASDKLTSDKLGYSLAMSSDGSTIVSGAYGADPGSVDAGVAYVFTKPGGGWVNGTETAKLSASDKASADQFGFNVAVSGDGLTIAIDANNAAISSIIKAGAVYVFMKPGGGWISATQTAKLTASDYAANDYLGASVSVNSDGSVIVAGAYGSDPEATVDAGAAYVYVKPAGDWVNATQTCKLTASDKAAGDAFGFASSISSDGSTIAVGSYKATIGAITGAGAVYLFSKPAGGWTNGTETSKVFASDGAASDWFGRAVSLCSDGSYVAIGASYADPGGINAAGAAYIFGPVITGINEFPKRSYNKVYPNPVKDYMYVTTPDDKLSDVKIYDITGKMISEKKITNGQVGLQDMKPGLYFVKIGTDTFKIIKK
jgi:hypothetical protein